MIEQISGCTYKADIDFKAGTFLCEYGDGALKVLVHGSPGLLTHLRQLSGGDYSYSIGEVPTKLIWVEREGPTLWGFQHRAERAVFERLCKVKRVGPATAMKALGAFHWDESEQDYSLNLEELKKMAGPGTALAIIAVFQQR